MSATVEKKVRAPRAKKEKPVPVVEELEDDYDEMEIYMRIFKDRLTYHMRTELDALDSKAYSRAFGKFMEEMRLMCDSQEQEFNASFSEVVPAAKQQ